MNYYKKNSALEVIKKRKISLILKDPNNNICFECSKINPEFISLNNAIFLCKNCINNHLNLPKYISNIINNNLNHLSMKNIQYLSYGGNKNLKEFILNNFPDLIKISPNIFYYTKALDYYRKMIEYLVEGGIKPVMPNVNNAYELIININSKEKENIKQNIEMNYQRNNMKLIRKIKSDSFIKFRNNPYPKIKPIIGSNTATRTTYFSNSRISSNNNKLSQTITNLNFYSHSNNSIDEGNYYKTHKNLNSSTIDNKRTFYPNFRSNYDIDDDIYNTSNIKATINKNRNSEIREKILKNDINNLNSNQISNNIYRKYMSQNYLNIYRNNKINGRNRNLYAKNNNSYNIHKKSNTTTLYNYGVRKNINNMELRSYLQNNCRNKDNYIFNLKLNSAKPTLMKEFNEEIKKNNTNINNINNNIIINRNLNVFYNNNNNSTYNYDNSKTIFKKKPLGNSFSLNHEKKHSVNEYSHSREKLNSFDNLDNIINIQINKNKKIVDRNENTFIKVNKIKPIHKTTQEINKDIYKNKNSSLENMQITVKKNLNDNNNNKENENQESMIIQRISRVIKIQKEREEKKRKNNEINNLSQNPSKYKFKILNVEKVKNKNKEKDNKKLFSINEVKENKIKTNKKKENINNNKNIIEPRKTNHYLMRELNNLPSGKKKSILEIIKTNILSSKSSISSDYQKILKISSNNKNLNKK